MTTEDSLIPVIDGSILEGGGQILRNAIAYSGLLEKSIKIVKIRAGRSKPGLRAQHLCGLELIRDVCRGQLTNGYISSTEIVFIPKAIESGCFSGDTKTAGSVCLMMQTAIPCLSFGTAQSRLNLKGGTNADMAPQADYMEKVTLPVLTKFGIDCTMSIAKRGFFPKGGGHVTVTVNPIKRVNCLKLLEQGEVTKIHGLAFVAGALPIKVAHIMADSAQGLLQKSYPTITVTIERKKFNTDEAVGTGSGIIIVAETSTGCILASSSLGNRDRNGETVGHDAAEQLLENLCHGGCVDNFMQDQIIIFMALADGSSSVKCGKITLHTKTAIHVAELLTNAKFKIESIHENLNIIHCDGINLTNKVL